jgi:hypothetical protein
MGQHERPGLFALAQKGLLRHIAGEEAVWVVVGDVGDDVLEVGFMRRTEARLAGASERPEAKKRQRIGIVGSPKHK